MKKLFLNFAIIGILANISISALAFDYLYAGESNDRKMYIVKDGKITWRYDDPHGRGEISDAILLTDGHILMAHQYGIREIIPDLTTSDQYKMVWQMDSPQGYEIHSIQPLGKDKVMYVQCGDPMQVVIMEIPSMREVKRINLPYKDGGSHGQMRNFRITHGGTILLASFQYGAIIEFDSTGKELKRIAFPNVWGVEELKNGNILACSTKGLVREYDRNGNTVWEYNWAANPKYKDLSCQKAHRLKNGNTLINSWFNEWGGRKPSKKNPPVQAVEVTPGGKIVWELRSWKDPMNLGPSTTIQPLDQPVDRDALFFGDTMFPTNKKEIMDRFLAGTLDPSYVPAGFFIHFGNENSAGESAVKAHLKYFLQTNQDIIKVQFEQRPDRIKDLDKQETWDNIKPLPEDFYAPTLEIIKRINDIVGKDVYILPTIYSPYQVARQSIGEPDIVKAARQRPEDLKRVLGYYADALIWLVKQCKAIGIEGFYTCSQGGEMKFYDIPGFFDNFIKPFDLKVMNECNKDTKLTVLHICDWEGPFDDLTRFKDYPGSIVNTPIRIVDKPFTLQDGMKLFNRPVLGGLDRHQEIIHASESDLVNKIREVLKEAPVGKTMLGAECTVGGAPIANLHVAVSTAHHMCK